MVVKPSLVLIIALTRSMDSGAGYTVVVSEISSTAFGTSETFSLLPALATPAPSSITDAPAVYDGQTDFQEGTVGSMNVAMIIVASLCGE